MHHQWHECCPRTNETDIRTFYKNVFLMRSNGNNYNFLSHYFVLQPLLFLLCKCARNVLFFLKNQQKWCLCFFFEESTQENRKLLRVLIGEEAHPSTSPWVFRDVLSLEDFNKGLFNLLYRRRDEVFGKSSLISYVSLRFRSTRAETSHVTHGWRS